VRLKRRQLLQALGLGAVSSVIRGERFAHADPPTFPSRIVLYVQPHGHIPNAWQMAIPNGPTDAFAELALTDLAQTDLSPTLQPLYAFRDRMIGIEGLSHTSALADIEAVTVAGSGDLNNHQVGVADVLTGTRALQQPGTYCTGGAATIDQVLAARLSAPGRFDSRVYGFDYIPNSVVSPFSYLGPGEATPMVSDPAAAYADLLGYVAPAATPTNRADLIASLRPSVLDSVSREYDLLAPKLGAEGKQKLDAHRDLVTQLEASLGAIGPAANCNTTFDATVATTSGGAVRQFMDLIRLAFACDLTRIVTFSAPVPLCPELGYPGDATFHMYAHQSIDGATSCGQTFSPLAAQAMTDLDAWHAGHVAYLCQQLDSVIEGSGTMLDHTVVVWVTELATPTHLHYDTFTVLIGGCNGFFETGRYVRYPQTMPSPMANQPLIGPAHNRLLVSLMQAMGQPDTTFGMTGTTAIDGTQLSFQGPLTELQGG
jgi:Protein of unknown function (DUF1552)